ncbi:uncharacterized protein LOC108825903 isoform X3 [Raphanus sativus]|uniref:Uncharacterized protein LOC108825903 isoform X3 n=1 Tax=Raphanus sativus TaxID=3726 RepID=A0A9W3CG87_RAPSA|nr:uncharacterized protein LOC108825903 isoform X3 [Raphanus sativus]
MSSLDYRPPSFICLVVKNKADYWFPKKTVGETTYFIIDNSYISDVQYENTSNSHHLQPVLGCNNKEGERSDQYCWACRSYKIVLFLSEILGFAEFVAERWMKTMDHILAQRIAPMQCTLTVLLCSMYGLVKNSRAKQSWKMTILSRRLRRWMMGLYDILGMRTIA